MSVILRDVTSPGVGRLLLTPNYLVDRLSISMLVLVVSATPTVAQRHGRADSAQNYAKGIPDATLTIRTPTSKVQLQRQQLSQYPTTTQDIDPQSQGRVQSISGVPISALPGLSVLPPDQTLEIRHGFFRTRRIRMSDLATDTMPVIVQRIDGKPIDRASLFYILLRLRTGAVIRVKAVREIRIGHGD